MAAALPPPDLTLPTVEVTAEAPQTALGLPPLPVYNENNLPTITLPNPNTLTGRATQPPAGLGAGVVGSGYNPPPIVSQRDLARVRQELAGAGPAPTRYSFDQLRQLAINSGFQGPAADRAAAIALAESSGDPTQINKADPGGSYGLMQINQASHPGTASRALMPQGSFDLAYQISKGGRDFSPWTTYRRGVYAKYLPEGSSAEVSSGSAPAPASRVPSLAAPIQETQAKPSGAPAAPVWTPPPSAVTEAGEGAGLGLMVLGSLLKGVRYTPVDYDPFRIWKLGAQPSYRLGSIGGNKLE